jgi:hypothetical protein
MMRKKRILIFGIALLIISGLYGFAGVEAGAGAGGSNISGAAGSATATATGTGSTMMFSAAGGFKAGLTFLVLAFFVALGIGLLLLKFNACVGEIGVDPHEAGQHGSRLDY